MKHNLKRLLSFVLALAMCMSMVWVPAFAAEVGTTNPTEKVKVNSTNILALARLSTPNTDITLCKGQMTENFGAAYGLTGADYSQTAYESEKIDFKTTNNILPAVVTAGDIIGKTVVKFITSDQRSKGTLTVTIRDHNFTNYTYNDDATCTENGTETASCDYGCGATNTRYAVGSALGHDCTEFVEKVDSTCNSTGYTTYKCVRCKATENKDETPIDPDNHSFTNYVSNNNATCTENGTETATCDNGCGKTITQTEANSATGHNWDTGVPVLEPTDTEWGQTLYTCLNCGETETKTDIKPTGHVHTPDEPVETVTKEATCLTSGSKKVTITCTECGETYYNQTEEIPVDPDAHVGEIEDTYENIDLDKGTYTAIHTYSGCRHFTTETVDMKLEPNVDIDKILKPTSDNDNKIVNQTAHAGQNVNFSLETGWLADALNVQYRITYNPELVELTLNGATVPNNSTKDFKYNSETKYVLKAKDTMEEQVTDVTYSFKLWLIFTTIDYSTTVHLTITPHEATDNIVNVHEPTCTEPGKKTTDVFCRKCGTLLNSELKETLTDPLGHILGTPKWTWVLTENAKEWDVSAKLHCGRMNCNHSEELSGVSVATSTSGGYKTYTATVTGKDGTVYTCSKTEELTCSYTYNKKTVKCFYGQSVTLDAGKKSNWFVNGTLVAAGTSTYTFRVSRENEVITSEPSEEEDAVTALTTVKRISNADGTYTAKFTTDWYVPADEKVKEVKTYYRMTNTNQTQATLVAKNQYVTSKLTSNVGTFVANVPIKPDYGTKYDVWAVSCVILEDNTHIWSKVVCNERAK